jgi:hypothetical protein
MTGIEVGLGIAAVFGAGTQTYGMIKGAAAQSAAAEQTARLKNAQADEILSRELINEQMIRENSARLESGYFVSFASTGAEGGLGGVLQIQRQTERNLVNAKRDAEFKASQLRAGADIDLNLASDALSASYITGAGTILGFGAKAYSLYRKSGTTESLAQVGGG